LLNSTVICVIYIICFQSNKDDGDDDNNKMKQFAELKKLFCQC